jgi:hypothetical protein
MLTGPLVVTSVSLAWPSWCVVISSRFYARSGSRLTARTGPKPHHEHERQGLHRRCVQPYDQQGRCLPCQRGQGCVFRLPETRSVTQIDPARTQAPRSSAPTRSRSSARSSRRRARSSSSSRPARPSTTSSASSSRTSRRATSSSTVATRTTRTRSAARRSSSPRASSSSAPVSPVVRRVPATARPSCPVAPRLRGPPSRRSSRRLLPRSTASPAATGSVRPALATTSRWSTTVNEQKQITGGSVLI